MALCNMKNDQRLTILNFVCLKAPPITYFLIRFVFFGGGYFAQSKQMKRAQLTPGGLDQVPRASHLGGLVLEWWIHWEGVLFFTMTFSTFIPNNLPCMVFDQTHKLLTCDFHQNHFNLKLLCQISKIVLRYQCLFLHHLYRPCKLHHSVQIKKDHEGRVLVL